MHSNERVTLTVYPVWLVWLGRGLLYLALLMAPTVLALWVAEQAPPSMKTAAQIAANVVLLPLLYAALYWLLRHFRARAQNFIWLVIALFGIIAWSQWRKATTVGTWDQWLGVGLCAFYTVGFAALAVWGWRRNQSDRLVAAAAERQAQIDLHAEAVLRAQTLERQRTAPPQDPSR